MAKRRGEREKHWTGKGKKGKKGKKEIKLEGGSDKLESVS